MGILWIIIVGFIAGLIARFLAPGPNKPVGFLLTTALGIAGAFVATYIGQAVGWYRLDQGGGNCRYARRLRRVVCLESARGQPHDRRSGESARFAGTGAERVTRSW
jgi:uncharacterized membrane protein YeaQ/YmgE (transglycosylase-associated protein family)